MNKGRNDFGRLLMRSRWWYALIWLSRIRHCRGFGIQSPTDYYLERHIINESWPYYAYEWVGENDDWLTRKVGQLCFRLANYRQPRLVVSQCYCDYLQAACPRAQMVSLDSFIEMAVLSAEEWEDWLSRCDDQSVVVVPDIYRHREAWKQLVADERAVITFDLYYCGVVLTNRLRAKQHYVVNF